MRLLSIRIENYRCFDDVTIRFDDLTVLVGANGSGKSTALRAIEWFFNGADLERDDVFRHQEGAIVRVSATFGEFTPNDREALGAYARGDTAILSRVWSTADGMKLTGRAFTFPAFDDIRAIEGAVPRRSAYNDYVAAHPELALEPAANREELAAAMAAFEQAHPDLLEPTEAEATHLFGFVGGAKLNGRYAFVFVPAVSDAHEQLAGARGSLLSRLIERVPSEDAGISEQLEALQVDTQERANALLQEQHGGTMSELGNRITEAMRQFVPAAEVKLDIQPPAVRVSGPVFDVQVADDGISTDVGHQGHGFQRALIMAALNELARSEHEGDVPAVFLAIEEPELYQHPLQARHFARVLEGLPRRGEGSFQVSYATHSQYFIDPQQYERLRRFSRRRADGKRIVTVASTAKVAARLAGILQADQIPQRIKMTLERQIAEAVFAEVAALTEGKSDAGFLSGIADRRDGFESQGIAIVNVEGKSKLPVALAVLDELGIPTYVVFDADRGMVDRAPAEVENTKALNRRLLNTLGADAVDWPDSTVTDRYAIFADRVEDVWPAAMAEAQRLAEAEHDNPKREEWYREAARTLAEEPPEQLGQIVAAIERLR